MILCNETETISPLCFRFKNIRSKKLTNGKKINISKQLCLNDLLCVRISRIKIHFYFYLKKKFKKCMQIKTTERKNRKKIYGIDCRITNFFSNLTKYIYFQDSHSVSNFSRRMLFTE